MKVNQSGSSPVQGRESAGVKQSGQASGAKGSKKAEAAAAAATDRTKDTKLNISEKGKEFARAKAVASQAPDVREDRIAELKGRIASGGYKVDADAVADRIVDEHLRMPGID